jgi:hypothetical protein
MNLVRNVDDLLLWSIHIEFRILRMLCLSFCSCLCETKEVGKLGHSCARWPVIANPLDIWMLLLAVREDLDLFLF